MRALEVGGEDREEAITPITQNKEGALKDGRKVLRVGHSFTSVVLAEVGAGVGVNDNEPGHMLH